ncbi:MAG: apolipoprotein N-acyltransferase [Luteolibacter sp.]
MFLRCVLAAVSGVVYAMAYPPVDLGWLVLVGLAGFLFALKGISGTRARVVGLVFGVVAFGVSLSWLWNIFAGVAVLLWCVLALFMVLFAEMQGRAFKRGVNGWKFVVFTAVNWGAFEFLRAEVFPLKLPWMTTGLAVGANGLLPWVGVYGVGFVVVLLVAAGIERVWKVGVGALVLLAVSLFFWGKHPEPDAGDEDAVRMSGVQLEGVSMTDYLMATQAMDEGVEYVVWPEYAVPYDVRENERDWELLLKLCKERGITLTLGTQARPGGGDVWRNIALTMDGSGFLGEHTKMHPVHFFDDGEPGKVAGAVKTEHGLVGTPICFDADYENVVRKMVAAGAELILVPTMDAESWSARQHDQHAELARMRAAENGRWVFVCATSGVSQVIDPAGFVHRRLGAMEQGEISGVVLRERGMTFYTRVGWAFGWVVLGAGFCVGGLFFGRGG